MRWRTVGPDGRLAYMKSPHTRPSVSRQLADELASIFRGEHAAPYRLVGHSLGSQVRACVRVCEREDSV